MAIEGNLKDMSLPNLVQTICLEQRRTALILRRRRMEEGVIFFDGGEIVHAAAGSLKGEEAVYHLLSWSDGAFRQSDHVTIPHQTIAVPWNHLLLEGMKRIDHQETAGAVLAQVERELSPAEIERDSALENELISLLSQLEQLRTQVADRRTRKRPAVTLRTLAEMVNHAVGFVEGLGEEPSADSLTEAVMMVGESHPAVRLLQAQQNRLSLQTVSKLYSSWSGDPTGRKQVFHQVAQALLEILEVHFVRLTSCLGSPSMANQWRETCRVFLNDLALAVEEVSF